MRPTLVLVRPAEVLKVAVLLALQVVAPDDVVGGVDEAVAVSIGAAAG